MDVKIMSLEKMVRSGHKKWVESFSASTHPYLSAYQVSFISYWFPLPLLEEELLLDGELLLVEELRVELLLVLEELLVGV